MNTLIAFVGLGWTEILIVCGVMLLLFGHRLPSVMRSLGQGIVEFKKGVNDVQDDIEDNAKGKKIKEDSDGEEEE